jgi:hypothetical protein
MKRYARNIAVACLIAAACLMGARAAYAAVTSPVMLLDVKSFGTGVSYFRKVPSILYFNFLDGAVYNSATRSLDIGGLLDVGPPTLPTAVASAATISAPTGGNTFHVTGVTQINTINSPFGGRSGCINIIPDGLFATGTSGNIALATTAVVSKVITECWDPTTTKWYPSY